MPYDLVIRNGHVIDGTGAVRVRADVGVVGDRIARVGRIRERGKEEIDAEGHVVTPGFVDCHTHMDAQIMWDPLGRSSCYQGVTTVTMGNCGFTLAPASAAQRPLVVRNLERAEDIAASAMEAGITDWSWETFPEYLDALDRLPLGINYATQVGHSALRTWAMGERAFDEAATEDDLATMARGLSDGIRAGAVGFSTSRSPEHQTADNRPVASRAASWEELQMLVGIEGELGAGVFQLALGPDVRVDDDAERRAAQDRFLDLAVETGVLTTFNVFPRVVDGDKDWLEQLDLLDRTAAAGGRMVGQSSSRGVSALSSFRTKLPFDTLPEWQEVRGRPLDEQQRLLRDPDVRKRLVHAAYHGVYGDAVGAEARKPDFEKLRIVEQPLAPFPMVADVAAAAGVDPVELMIDIALERDFNVFFMQAIGVNDPEALLPIMQHPRTAMTFSDSGAHVSQIMDATVQTTLLSYWVRDREAFTLEEAVRMITLVPSTVWGFHDRGLVREGLRADLNVIDPETVGPELPVVVDDLPSGARRLDLRAKGIHATVVNGDVLLRDGAHTGVFPGRLLRGPLATN